MMRDTIIPTQSAGSLDATVSFALHRPCAVFLQRSWGMVVWVTNVFHTSNTVFQHL